MHACAYRGVSAGAQVWRGENGEYEVECILDAKGLGSRAPRFYIRWRGYGSEYNTWEPLRCLDSDPFGSGSLSPLPLACTAVFWLRACRSGAVPAPAPAFDPFVRQLRMLVASDSACDLCFCCDRQACMGEPSTVLCRYKWSSQPLKEQWQQNWKHAPRCKK